MKRIFALAGALLLVAGVVGLHTPEAASQTNAGWITLFDGKGLDSFNRIGEANWRIEDGAVVADKGAGGHLVSKQSFTDFQIRAEFWVSDDANSGIFIRCTDPEKVGTASAYEVNIFDTRPDPSYGTGAIVDLAKVSPMPKAGGKWNTYEITAQGPQFTVVLNGIKTVDGAKSDRFKAGPISLQYGAGVVKFRKVEIKPL